MNKERLQKIKDSIDLQEKIMTKNMLVDEEKELYDEVVRLTNIIKEVREYIIQYGNLYCLKHKQFKDYHQYKVILGILDKENK